MLKAVYKVSIDPTKCKGRDLCLNVCPKKVFCEGQELTNKGSRILIPDLIEQCSNCELCKYFCPEGAISLGQKPQLDEFWARPQDKRGLSLARGSWEKVETIKPGRHFLSGNTACAWVFLDAGCRFFAGYPITPATEQSYDMERLMPSLGGIT